MALHPIVAPAKTGERRARIASHYGRIKKPPARLKFLKTFALFEH
jgi:hypothetical protein